MAKKNYRPTAADRKRLEEKKLAQKQAKRRAIWDQYKKQIIITAIAAVAAIIVLVLAIDFFYVPAGSMRTFLGNVLGASEGSLIREVNGHYYELATMEAPEGYAAADYGMNMLSDDNETFLYYETEDEAKAINNIYVSGVKNKNGADMLTSLAASGIYLTSGEARTEEIAGSEVSYMYTQSQLTNTDGDVEGYYAMLVMYVDTIQDSTVLLNCSTAHVATQEELPTEETLRAEVEGVLASLKLPE